MPGPTFPTDSVSVRPMIDHIKKMPPNTEHPLITIAIPVKNPDEKVFAQCLRSLQAQELFPYCEIVIIDSSTHPVKTYQDFKDILRVFPLTRKNVSGARQDALDHARGKILVGIDSDCIAEPGWLEALLHPLDSERGIVASMGYNLPGVDGWISNWFQNAYEGWLYHMSAEIKGLRYLLTLDTKNYAVLTDVAREVGFDDDLRAGEDHDFGTRLRRAGYHMVHTPMAKVRHVHRQTLPQLLRQQGWHGFGYGQTVVKNHLDIYCRRPFRYLVKQSLIFLLFPIFLAKLAVEYRKGGWEGMKGYIVTWLITYRFQMGMIHGMAYQGGWRYLKKRFISDIFSSYPEAEAERL